MGKSWAEIEAVEEVAEKRAMEAQLFKANDDLRAAIQTAAHVLMDAVCDLIQSDPHQWSERPCQTCRAVSSIIGKPFGCSLYALSRKAGR